MSTSQEINFFFRCVRDEQHLNVAGAEVVAILLVIVLVLACVAGFLGYKLRMQMARTAAAAKAAASRTQSSGFEERMAAAAAAALPTEDTTEEKLLWPEREERPLSVISE